MRERVASACSALVVGLLMMGCGSGDRNPDLRSPDLVELLADGGRSTNLLAVGAWSEPVKDRADFTLRGRLLLFDTPPYVDNSAREWWGNAPVYLELQNLSASEQPLAVYFSISDGLECQLRNSHGQLVGTSPRLFVNELGAPRSRQNWVTVPYDGSVRLRADPQLGGFSPKPNGLVIELSMTSRWSISPTNGITYLSGDFSPPADLPGPPDSHVWSGKVELPAIKIPVPKP